MRRRFNSYASSAVLRSLLRPTKSLSIAPSIRWRRRLTNFCSRWSPTLHQETERLKLQRLALVTRIALAQLRLALATRQPRALLHDRFAVEFFQESSLDVTQRLLSKQ